jgi:tRNA threonylcarbamoyladenosine biosynthesis protein TsaB
VTVIVGFDTATPDTVVAAGSGSEVRIGPGEDGRPAHGRALLGAIEEAVTGAGGWEAIELIAVGIGPGSFTGLRIGISTARALGQARGLPIAGVPSTAALLAGIPPAPGGAGRLALIDARRSEVFAALDTGAGAGEPVVCPPAELAVALGLQSLAGISAAGDGALRFRAEIEAAGAAVLPESEPAHHLSARWICELGAEIEPTEPAAVRPLYLRRPDAERWRERDGSN